jgi:thiamine kinase-like enzyme
MNPIELLQQINKLHQITLTMVKQFAQGEQGAFAVAAPAGKQYVLKWRSDLKHADHLHYVKAITNHLRAQGYPTPEYLWSGHALGGTYYLQTVLPGTPLQHITQPHLTRLLELNKMQIGQAPPGPRHWPQVVVNTVLFGGQEYCTHASLQQYSPITAHLLLQIQEIVRKHKEDITETNDIVHFDFHNLNMLVYQQEISGIIDWDATCAGDAAFDLATLLFYAYDEVTIREQLWQHILRRTPLSVVSVYLAHLILRQVDWSLRHYHQTISHHYIARSQALLQEIEYRSGKGH